MKLQLTFKLALKNLKANKLLNTAFILSSSIMLAILQIYSNIESSDYVKAKEAFSLLSFYGLFLITLFSFIFILYANSTLIKARSRELALYGILGLEKKHIMLIIFFESLLTALSIIVISAILTFSLGKVLFLLTGKLLRDPSITTADYHYYPFVFISLLAFLGFSFTIILLYNFKNIRNAPPIALLNQSKSVEKEPKSRWFLTLLGLVILALGYGIALITKGTLQSLGMFFVAALLVMVATYYLFSGLSIILLKFLRYNKNYYYQKKHFIFISGMLSRMKSNAVGLASISILITGLILTLAVSLSIYQSINKNVDARIDRDYQITITTKGDTSDDLEKTTTEIVKQVNTVLADEKVQNTYFSPSILVYAMKSGDTLEIPTKEIGDKVPCFLEIGTLDSYNKANHSNITLEENQILIAGNSSLLELADTVDIAGKTREIIPSELTVSNYLAIEAYGIIVPNYKDLLECKEYYTGEEARIRSGYKEFARTAVINYTYAFDLDTNKNYLPELKTALEPLGAKVENRESIYQTAISLNGGILFTGIIIAILFLVGTTLIIYYKQLTEAYQDRNRIGIMQKVGLSKELIKKTSEEQISWLFFTPLLIALIHSIVASKIVFQLLALFGIYEYKVYAINMVSVTLIIALIYFIIFKITANLYYKIVTE